MSGARFFVHRADIERSIFFIEKYYIHIYEQNYLTNYDLGHRKNSAIRTERRANALSTDSP